MTEQISLLDDQLVDMRFLTKLTGLTDKWFYKLIKDGDFPKLNRHAFNRHLRVI